MSQPRMKYLALSIILALMAGGCADAGNNGAPPDRPPHRALVPMERIPVERRSFSGLTWLTNGWLVVEILREAEAPRAIPRKANQLWRLRPDGTGFSRIALPDGPRCHLTEYPYPTALGDGRLGIMKWCSLERRVLIQPFAYDMRSKELTPLMDAPFERLHPVVYGWNPSLSRGITSDSSVICATLVWLMRGGIAPVRAAVKDEGRVYRLELYDPEASDCPRQPRADLPAWSPDGESIAFFFSSASVPLTGQARLDAPWDLYVTDPDFTRPKKQVTRIVDPGRPVWSPDSRWVAFSGEIPGRGPGTWLYEPASGQLKRIATWEMRLLAWSPDGDQIAAVERMPARSSLLLFDVSRMTNYSGG